LFFISWNHFSSSLPETDAEVSKSETESDHTTVPHNADETEQISKPMGVRATITTAFGNAGYTLEGAEAELVLNPLRLAFETKNIKVLELALDCLHVRACFDCVLEFEKFCFTSRIIC
ncbi:hypothetical protein U1Q18_007843, partial [Sarracenia purpurea var. burkii]